MKIAKVARERAADRCQKMASWAACEGNQTSGFPAHFDGWPNQGLTNLAFNEAWRTIVTNGFMQPNDVTCEMLYGEAEALLRTGWSPS